MIYKETIKPKGSQRNLVGGKTLKGYIFTFWGRMRLPVTALAPYNVELVLDISEFRHLFVEPLASVGMINTRIGDMWLKHQGTGLKRFVRQGHHVMHPLNFDYSDFTVSGYVDEGNIVMYAPESPDAQYKDFNYEFTLELHTTTQPHFDTDFQP